MAMIAVKMGGRLIGGLLGPFQLLIAVNVLFGMVGTDMPRCHKDKPDFTASPYCLPHDYNKDIVPPTNEPLGINVDIWVFEVSKIDDIALSMTFELYFDLTWKETRFLIDHNSSEWSVDGVMGSTNFINDMWLPDIQILHLKQFQKRNILTDVAGLIIFEDKRILYTVSTEAVISCPMKFSAYPLDFQECRFLVGSYIHDATQIVFTGTFGHDTKKQRAQQYEIKITELDEEDKSIMWANRNFTMTGFKINMVRRRTPVLLQVYLPSGLFVVVSWISFIVPPEIVPGRMALLVTLFLVLVNIFNSVTANAPKSEGLTAVETWVVMCILHVFCVLAEYAILLKFIQTDKRKAEKMRKNLAKGLMPGMKRINGTSTSEGTQRVKVIHQPSGSSTPLEQIFETDPDYADARAGLGVVNPAAAAVSAFGACQSELQQHPRYPGGHSSSHENVNMSNLCRHRSGLHQQSLHHQAYHRSQESLEEIPDADASWNKISLSQSANNMNTFLMKRPGGVGVGGGGQQYVSNRLAKFDRVSMFLFPIIFFLFNVSYWSYYLILNDVLAGVLW